MNKDYAYNPDNDSNLINGIVINKPISINGNNHYVDGKNVSSSFYITNYNVNLWNVNLLNNPGLYTAGSNSYIEINGTNYKRFCLNHYRNAVTGKSFLLSNMSVVLNNNDHSNVADYIKIIIYYDILNNDATVWDFTDEDYLHSSKSGVQKVISLYDSGVRVPDTAFKKINDTTFAVYDFVVVYSPDTRVQNLFGYNVEYYTIIYNMSLSKTCMDPNVSVGDTVRFVLNITNTGNWNITNPYIKEKSFDGLTYIGYTDDTGLWSYQDNYSWNYNGNLTEGQTAGLTVMFKVTKAGNFINIAVAGYNETTEIKYNVLENETYKVTANDTVTVTNDTNETVNVTDNETYEFEELEDIDETENVTENTNEDISNSVSKSSYSAGAHGTGNPLLILLIGLVSCIFVPLKRKK